MICRTCDGRGMTVQDGIAEMCADCEGTGLDLDAVDQDPADAERTEGGA